MQQIDHTAARAEAEYIARQRASVAPSGNRHERRAIAVMEGRDATKRAVEQRSAPVFYWVGQHNDRGMETKNAGKDAPPPFHSIGTGDARADLMAAHEQFKPKMIAGVVFGLEFVFTASPEAFDGLSKSSHMFKAHQLLDAAKEYLEDR